jgi:hypothetical protein
MGLDPHRRKAGVRKQSSRFDRVAADCFSVCGKHAPWCVGDCALDAISRLIEGSNAIKNLCLWNPNAFFAISFGLKTDP